MLMCLNKGDSHIEVLSITPSQVLCVKQHAFHIVHRLSVTEQAQLKRKWAWRTLC